MSIWVKVIKEVKGKEMVVLHAPLHFLVMHQFQAFGSKIGITDVPYTIYTNLDDKVIDVEIVKEWTKKVEKKND